MTYALYCSAEANRAIKTGDTIAYQNAISAASWLIENSDLDSDGQIGWGIPYAWDAFSDGTINPPNTEYAITTALVIQALLDTYDAIYVIENRPQQISFGYLESAVAAFRSFQDKCSSAPSGIFFWYSTNVSDSKPVINSHAMLTGQFRRLANYPVPEDVKIDLKRLSAEGFKYILYSKQKDNADITYWNYLGRWDPAFETRPNDSCHEMYTLQGILDYQRYSKDEIPVISESQCIDDIERFIDPTVVREFPRGVMYPTSYQNIIDQPARLWGIGYLLYMSIRLDADNLSDKIVKILFEQYWRHGTLVLRPDVLEDNFYPRHASHVLFGLSHYFW